VIHSIVIFSPAPESVAEAFLIELEKVEGMSSLGRSLILYDSQAGIVNLVRQRTSKFDCSTWAVKVIDYLRNHFSTRQRLKELEPVTTLATELLSHLLIAGFISYPHT
jgi:hypothetical protein